MKPEATPPPLGEYYFGETTVDEVKELLIESQVSPEDDLRSMRIGLLKRWIADINASQGRQLPRAMPMVIANKFADNWASEYARDELYQVLEDTSLLSDSVVYTRYVINELLGRCVEYSVVAKASDMRSAAEQLEVTVVEVIGEASKYAQFDLQTLELPELARLYALTKHYYEHSHEEKSRDKFYGSFRSGLRSLVKRLSYQEKVRLSNMLVSIADQLE